ncbi:MAG: aminoacetone oxidase family FAD-binding enzyme [Planctomycetota bacterium]
MDADVIIVGAGAAGLWAAAKAARAGARVCVLEKTARCGTKVLASGGTRCNLTTTLGPAQAARLFGPRGERFLRSALAALPPEAVREHFHQLGVPTVTAPLDKVFPASQRARDVRDALEGDARAAGVQILLDEPVLAIAEVPGGWRVDSEGGSRCAPRLGLATGGASVPKSGTTGDAWPWLSALGLKALPPAPALVPLTSPAPWVHELSGIALEDARLRLIGPDGKVLGERRRPVLFTHTGLSGPGAMDLSEPIGRAEMEGGPVTGFHLTIDLLPEHSFEELRAILLDAQGQSGRNNLAVSLPAPLPGRLLQQVARQAGWEADPRARGCLKSLDKGTRHRLIEALKGLEVPVHGTRGMDLAEVSSGGLDLRQLNPRTMEVNGHPGLFVFGELLDLQGPIGGLNFLAAWATAELAGAAMAQG